jgi:transposase InsO family protein
MDHFGPFEIRRKKKCWGLLFICLTTRAVHIEVCEDLTIPTWLNAMERFIARRGSPKKIFSDRGSTFVGGSKVFHQLTNELLDDDFYDGLRQQLATKLRIDFEVIPAGTPHYGGSWERMVQEAKRFLVKAASTVKHLTYDALVTFLVRAEGILNQRPLSFDDDNRIVTPAHILAPATTMGFGLGPNYSISRVVGQLRQAIQYFWRHWTDHYLKMTSAERYHRGHPMFIHLQPGDKVLVPVQAKGRAFGAKEFKVGQVVDVHHSGDRRPREVDVRDEEGLIQRLVATKLHLTEDDVLRRRQ